MLIGPCSTSLADGYQPYCSDTFTASSSSWTQNGTVTFGSGGLTSSSSSGSLISTVAVPDGTSSYEADMTLALQTTYDA